MAKSGMVSAIQNRGLVHLKSGELNLAIKDYSDALELLPNSAEVLFGRGMAKRKYGDEAGAFPDLSKAKSLEPDIAEKFVVLGVKWFIRSQETGMHKPSACATRARWRLRPPPRRHARAPSCRAP
jgi:tetratricopeptide (TPR) repeat protein